MTLHFLVKSVLIGVGGRGLNLKFLQLCRSCSKTFAIPYSNSHQGWSQGPVKKGPSGNHFLTERS